MRLRRAYEPAAPDDGYRVLVDRLWPRGVRRDELVIDEWCRQLAPSSDLRRWFGHDRDRWDEFQARYRTELAGNAELVRLADTSRRRPLTLVYAAADTDHNNAVVVRQVIGELADERSDRPHQ